MREFIFQFWRLTSLDDNQIVTIVAENIEEAEKRAREKVKDMSVDGIRDIWEIKNSQKIRII